ncbi:unnamed protein product [Closterium sp. NIES-65]|nr:unnamed protein product [Closterium sp. NIES-65]
MSSAGSVSTPLAGASKTSGRSWRSRQGPHPNELSDEWRRPPQLELLGLTMTTDALALMAVALAEASPGGVLGSQVPALLRAVSALAGPAASSSTSLVQRRRRRRSGALESLPQPGRAPASLRPRQQQAFRRSQRQSSRLPPLGRRLAPQSQQTPPPPARSATPAPVTRIAPPPQYVPDSRPASSPQPPPVQPAGWQRAKLSRRQRQRQRRQQTPGPQALQQPRLQTPHQPPPRAAQPPPAQSPLRRFPLPLHPHQHRSSVYHVPPSPPPPAQVPQSVSGPSSFHQYSFQGPPVQHPWVPVTPPAPPPPQAVVPGQPPTLVEQRVMHVGTCLTLLSYVLDQLHVTLVQQEVQIGEMQPAEQTAAVAAAEELQHYLPLIGFVPGSPGAALGPGPGALARLAESAQEDPLDLVAAAASVLRWLDGRLCWILVE